MKDTLRRLHDDFVLVPADKAANNVIVVCKKYYIEILIKELGINTTNISPNSTYIPSTDSFHEILKSHCKFIESVELEMSEEDKNLPYLYWTPKLHKVPFKNRFIAGSSKCTTKDLSCLLTKVLTTVKDGLIRYNNTKVHFPIFGGLSGSEDRGGGDNSTQFIDIGRAGGKSFKE